jgi:hypothetical protein
MNDSKVSQQLQQMLHFIAQEAADKANEIALSAEEVEGECFGFSGNLLLLTFFFFLSLSLSLSLSSQQSVKICVWLKKISSSSSSDQG